MITLTANENALLEISRAIDDNGKELIVKSLMCAVRFGDEFFNDIREYVERRDGNAIRSIVESYSSRLEREGAKQ